MLTDSPTEDTESTALDNTPLSLEEEGRFTKLEDIVRNNCDSFLAAGSALFEIRNSRFYRRKLHYKTFGDYCQDRWKISRAYANRLISASSVDSDLAPMGAIRPTSERQLRPLAAVDPDQRPNVWGSAVASADGEQPTAKEVQAAADRITGARKTRHSSKSEEWYTPRRYIEAVIEVLGGIDLDPASNEVANEKIGAEQFLTPAEDGLTFEWHGRVFLNPPYGRNSEYESNQGLWSARMIADYEKGDIDSGILLVNVATESAWFKPLWRYPICFVARRIRFWTPTSVPHAPTNGSVFIYFGKDAELFADQFRKWGRIVVPKGTMSEVVA